ncbi:hypothetical protein AQUCO_05800004v1 [Aquilegia coerulea]|uniref:Inosine/uridine-preferring nucleoside hydrolase domain-containing protein n=1 Tax=Aquilegia coerulea TaxID=218851 RepID=A0A2G5CE68_AQUCA|nr:hypothetical protein AQUCO_05800004v1 [Aquilegia coerulea]
MNINMGGGGGGGGGGDNNNNKKKIIIDTDPGIDDAMAILVALESPEVDVIGLTTIFGNVYTTLATRNALHLLELAGRSDIPVAEGSHLTITIFGDPEAADLVFTSGADILAVGINVTHQVVLTDADRERLAKSRGKFAQYLCKILDIYFSYHRDAYNTKGVYLHDPTTLLAAVNPSLITCTEGVVRVQTNGITRGLTMFYNTKKRFAEVTEWSDKPVVKVAVTVDAPAVVALVMERLIRS